MPPDEYHWPVNDSVYTNYIAKISLQTVEKIPSASAKKNYKTIADNIYIPFNVTGQWHPEYDSYQEGLCAPEWSSPMYIYIITHHVRITQTWFYVDIMVHRTPRFTTTRIKSLLHIQ